MNTKFGESSVNMADAVNVRQLFFTNVQLLGLDPVSMERKWRIPFNRDMFVHPNKRGFEVVMFFLFGRLNDVMCREQFRDCWPVGDKKQEQQFRKVCNNWLHSIAAEDSTANLPRIVASLFMSPGGDKFYLMLVYFSTYVLKKMMQDENGVKTHEYQQWPVLTKQCISMSRAMDSACKASTIRTRKIFLDHIQQSVAIQQEWKVYASELVKTYRTQTKDIRDLEHELKDEIETAAQRGAARGSPVSRRKSGMPQYDFDIQSVKRAERIRKVRELWKGMDVFHDSNKEDQEIVESIVEGAMERYKINGTDLNVRVPDLLLRECEKEIQRRSVDNIYQGGKLNILSLVHLWNLSLHLYIEKLHQVGVPTFDEVMPMVTTQVHTHRAHLTNAQQLRNHMQNKSLPELKESIKALKSKLHSQLFKAQSPGSIRLTCIGLGLIPPTPPFNFDTEDVDMESVPGHEHLKMSPEQVSTPEAATALMNTIEQRVHSQQMRSLVQGTPIYALRLANTGQPTGTNNIPISKVPVKQTTGADRVGSKTRTRFLSAPTNALGRKVATPGGMAVTSSGTTLQQLSPHETETARIAMTSQVTRSKTKGEKGFKAPAAIAKKTRKTRVSEVTPKVERHKENPRPTPKSPKAHDILADKIAEAVISGTPSVDHRHVIGGDGIMDLANDLDAKAFERRDKLAWTPPGQSKPTWPGSPSEESVGPLSSTRLDQIHEVERGNVDRVVTKLFSDDSEGEDERITTVAPCKEPRPEPLSQRRHHPSGSEDPPASVQGVLSPLTGSPVADRVRDLNVGAPQSQTPSTPTSGLPKERSFALTPGAIVMTGDLLGMQETDHTTSVQPGTRRTLMDWSDHSDESDTDYESSAAKVAAIPLSNDGDDSDSSLSGVNAVVRELAASRTPELPTKNRARSAAFKCKTDSDSNSNNNSGTWDTTSILEELGDTKTPQLPIRNRAAQRNSHNNFSSQSSEQQKRHIIGAEQNESYHKGVNQSGLSKEPMSSTQGAPDVDLLIGFDDILASLPVPLVTCEEVGRGPGGTTDNNGNLVDLDLDSDGLEDVANVSTHVNELQNSEKREVSPPKRKPKAEDSSTSRHQDTDQTLIASFVDSTLRDLSGDIGRMTLGLESVGGSRSPSRSRSPRLADPVNKAPADLNAADIITRYRLFRQGSFGKTKSTSLPLPNGAGSRQTGKRSPLASAPHTPEVKRTTSPLSDKYLQRTPKKDQEERLVRRFSLELDGDEDNDDDMLPLHISLPEQFEGGHEASPLSLRKDVPAHSPYKTNLHTSKNKTPGIQDTPFTRLGTMPPSPLTDILHGFNLDDSLSHLNIFNENDSVLLPSSPMEAEGFNHSHRSPAVGKLIDL